MDVRTFKRKRLVIRLISAISITGYAVYIILNIKSLQTGHWVSITAAAFVLIVSGRGFCGYLCPVGACLDLIHFVCKKLNIREVRRTDAFNRFIRIFRYFFCVFYFVLHFGLGIDPGWALVVLLIITTPVMVRFWCSICPVGTILGLFSRISIFRLKKNAGNCVSCSMCVKSCPMQNERVFKTKETGAVHDVSCIYCGECVGKCPKCDTLSLEVSGKKVIASGRPVKP